MDLRFSHRIVTLERSNETIAQVCAFGDWPDGSGGGQEAKALAAYVAGLVKSMGFRNVIVDFTNSTYHYGNSLLEFVPTAMRISRDFRYTIVAKGETRSNIESLLEISGISQFGFLGCYDRLDEAIGSFAGPKME